MGNQQTGADGINGRVIIGSLIIKHMCDFSDRKTVQQIQENMYMQYFIGYSSFSDEVPFDASLFVEIRNRLGAEQVNAINETILGLSKEKNKGPPDPPSPPADSSPSTASPPSAPAGEEVSQEYKRRFGYYPKEVLVDKIYCTRANRASLKELDIGLRAKPLGRPKAVPTGHVSPGERNPIEGKFGQAKTAYGMNRIRTRLQRTSESWIATIILVLNLVKLAGTVPPFLLGKWLTCSAHNAFSPMTSFINESIHRVRHKPEFSFFHSYSAGPK